MNSTRRVLLALLALAVLLPGRPAQAQLGGIKKKVGQAVSGQAPAVQSTGEPVVFDNVIVELTPARIARVVAGKNAGKKLASGPNSPAALRNKLAQVEDQQVKLSEPNVVAIQTWEDQRRAAENCRDSVLALMSDKAQANLMSPQAMQLGMQLAQAQAKGDSAEILRLASEMMKLNKPTAADSARATAQCPVPVPPPVVKQVLGLQTRIDSLNAEIARGEDAIRKAEAAASGMNDRQLAMACERARIYLERLKANKQQTGFTQAELDAIAQALKDLEAACT